MGPSSGVVAAVLLIMGTIFLGRAAKGRRRVPRRSLDHRESDLGNYPSLNEGESSNLVHQETNPSLEEETEQSNPRADVCAPDIFLSHSGRQKPFVESVYKALQGANHTAFFDQHTLPKGWPFPNEIKKAARGCKVGVVVLSEEFLTSKWPMVELEMLISQRGPKPCVLPLFYQLSPADLKSQEKLIKWRRIWKEMAGGENGANQWEQAVKDLGRFNGEVYTQGTSTDAYIKRVVKHICDLIPCHVPYDYPSIQGQSRLVQEIAKKFENLDVSRARMVGLHGVGGLGKTTLCKVMVNYYSRHYSGKSFLIEFPSGHGGDKSMITSECKKALNILTDASDRHLLDKADSFDQVVQLMRGRVGLHDVFLAIDNVWESSLDEAKRVLQAGFSANSKILVTSRSEGVLKDLVTSNASVAPLPAPEREEAFQIFQESSELCDLSILVDMNEMDNVLKRCRFSGSYHALALKALAKYVKRVCISSRECSKKKLKHQLSRVLEDISYKDLSDVETVIRLSYDHLPDQKKHLFLDIVFFLHYSKAKLPKYADVEEWISSILLRKFLKSKTTYLINELSLDGLIQVEVDKYGPQVIGVHDLYRELAWREIAKCPRFLIEGITEVSVEKVDWEKLEIVILEYDESRHCPFFEKLQQCKCPELKLLRAENIKIKSKVRLDSMPSLTVLELCRIALVENEHGSATLDSENKNVVRSDLLQPLELVRGMPSLDQKGPVNSPRSGGLVDASSILHLNGLVELRKLEVDRCGFVEEIAGLSGLVQLQVLSIRGCQRLQKLRAHSITYQRHLD